MGAWSISPSTIRLRPAEMMLIAGLLLSLHTSFAASISSWSISGSILRSLFRKEGLLTNCHDVGNQTCARHGQKPEGPHAEPPFEIKSQIAHHRGFCICKPTVSWAKRGATLKTVRARISWMIFMIGDFIAQDVFFVNGLMLNSGFLSFGSFSAGFGVKQTREF